MGDINCTILEVSKIYPVGWIWFMQSHHPAPRAGPGSKMIHEAGQVHVFRAWNMYQTSPIPATLGSMPQAVLPTPCQSRTCVACSTDSGMGVMWQSGEGSCHVLQTVPTPASLGRILHVAPTVARLPNSTRSG